MRLLRFKEVKQISTFKRNCTYVLLRLLVKLLNQLRLTWLINAYFEHKINKAFSDLNSKHPFSLNAVFTRPVIHNFWLMECPVSLLLNRVHDWVELDNHQVYVADNFITSGDWSGLLTDIRTSSVYKEAEQVQKYQLNFKQSVVYQNYVNKLAKGKKIVRNKTNLNSVVKLDQYFLRYQALFASIKTHGLLNLKEAKLKESSLNHVSKVRRWQASWTETEIGVAIGPKGEIATLPGAKHRLSIATMLGIKSARAQVRMVHIDWLAGIHKAKDQSWEDAIKVALQNMDQEFGGQ